MKIFEDDQYIAHTFLTIKNIFNIDTVIETGTFEGGTTSFLSKKFKRTFSIESNEHNYNVSINNLKNVGSTAKIIFGKSNEVLNDLIINESIDDKTIFFLDAHWWDNYPLRDELNIIAKNKLKPVIIIHDVLVPETKLGYDCMENNIPLDFFYIKDKIELIYDTQYRYWFNDDIYSSGAKRGTIYITPKV